MTSFFDIETAAQSENNSKPDQRAQSESGRILPCTIFEINKSSLEGEKALLSCGIEVSQISIVALIVSVKITGQSLDYTVTDRTDQITVRKFIDTDEENSNVIPENTYVRVVGQVKILTGTKFVLAMNIRPIKDMNAVTNHILEVIYARRILKKSSTFSLKGNSDSNSGGSLGEQIMNIIIKEGDLDRGVSIDRITSKLMGVSKDTIRREVQKLEGEGMVYSTVDDDHFKVTEN